jgi:hypothetical protein
VTVAPGLPWRRKLAILVAVGHKAATGSGRELGDAALKCEALDAELFQFSSGAGPFLSLDLNGRSGSIFVFFVVIRVIVLKAEARARQ